MQEQVCFLLINELKDKKSLKVKAKVYSKGQFYQILFRFEDRPAITLISLLEEEDAV